MNALEFRAYFGRSLDAAECAFHAICAIACWWATLTCLGIGRSNLTAAGLPPRTAPTILALATSPDLANRLYGWSVGSVALVVSAVLAVSAVEGTWWVLRRIGNRT